jgi:tetratricopeptide (TPR) repeat protein
VSANRAKAGKILATSDVQALEAELRAESPQIAIVLSARAALRAVPALSFLLNRNRNFKSRGSTTLILSVFRALQCSWYAAAEPRALDQEWLLSAGDEAESHARSIAGEGRSALFVPAYAAFAAADNNTPYTAAVVICDAPAANWFAANLTAFPAGRRQTADRVSKRTLEASEIDHQALRLGQAPRALAQQPIWPPQRKEYAWMRDSWTWIKGALHEADENWEVWTDWYDARLEGRSIVDPLEFARASIPNDVWSNGPRLINAHIKRLIAENAGEKLQDHISQAESFRRTDRLEEALQAYTAAIERFPENPVSYHGLADTLRDMGRLQDALIAYEAAIERFHADVFGYIGRADVLREMGHLDDSLREYERTIERFPADVVARNGHAEVLRAMGNLDEALQAYEVTIERFPADVVARNGRADVLRAMGNLDAALKAFEDTIGQFPGDSIAFTGRAAVLREMGRFEDVSSAPSEEAIPSPERLAVQFGGAPDGPIDLAAASSPGEHLQDASDRQEDYAELRTKAGNINSFGTNRLGHLSAPIDRFLILPEDIQQVRLKLFWSRINTLRVMLDAHEQATSSEVRLLEPDERRLEASVATLLKDFVETINVFVIGDAALMELDAARPGPQDFAVAKEEMTILAPALREAMVDPNVATESAQEALQEQVENLQADAKSLHERQAADFGRRTIRNFVSEILRRAYAPVRALAKSESGFAWRSVRDGAYQAIGAGALAGFVSELSGVTSFHQVLIQFVTRHAETLTAYVVKAFQNPALVEIIGWIARLGS